ncbi:MAG: molybdopterin-dependent oxidoreductase [Nitriliruptorales bacterium]|nr:molybdopterin-dependent oxidoreductase [Nitriliruptorales bacterium]
MSDHAGTLDPALQANKVGTHVGRSVPRVEDDELLRGEAQYVGDVRLPGMLHAAVYRSPQAHARIVRVDLDRVRAHPQVVAAFGASYLPRHVHRMEPFPFQSRDPFRRGNPDIKFHDRYGLARDKVRYVGEPVAVIVATSPYVAEDALELVDAEYELLPPVLDAEAATSEGSPLLYEDWGDNIALRFTVSNGDVDAAFAEADVVVRQRLQNHRFSGTPIEPRGVVASYDGGGNELTMWSSTQIPHVVAALLEDSVKEPANLKARVIAPRVGGGFGQKWGFYPEELLIPLASILTRRPVRWIETRREHMVATNHAREQTHHMEMALARDGTVLGVRDTIYADLGDAYPVGGFAAIITSAMYVPGAYRIQHYSCTLNGVVTNKTPFGAHRGFGKSEAAFVIERMMNIAAHELGMDAAELRQRNFIQPQEFPYRGATGSLYDSGNYPAALTRALELIDYRAARAEQERARAEGRLIGVGMALAIEPSSSTRMGSYNSGYYSVRVRMDPTGQVQVATGGNDEGQGHRTAIAQLTAEELGIDTSQVIVREGDSMTTPYGSGSYSSRFSVVGTSGVTMGARALAVKIKRIASHLLEVAFDDIELTGGRAAVKGDPESAIELRQLARTAYHRIHDLPEGEEPGLELTYHYRDPNVEFEADERGRVAMFSAFPYAADAAVVEIDPDTGQVEVLRYASVHDCGNVLNPRIVEGQHLGALAHGIGGALYEEFAFDEDGTPLNFNFNSYFVPTAMEIPEYLLDHLISPNPFTPGGYKGGGETGTVSPVPCLANAVEDSLRAVGLDVLRRTPLTPSVVWEELQRARGGVGT